MDPRIFIQDVPTFLFNLSRKLRAAVSIKLDEEGHREIYEWDSENETGRRVDLSEAALGQMSAKHSRIERGGLFYL